MPHVTQQGAVIGHIATHPLAAAISGAANQRAREQKGHKLSEPTIAQDALHKLECTFKIVKPPPDNFYPNVRTTRSIFPKFQSSSSKGSKVVRDRGLL